VDFPLCAMDSIESRRRIVRGEGTVPDWAWRARIR